MISIMNVSSPQNFAEKKINLKVGVIKIDIHAKFRPKDHHLSNFKIEYFDKVWWR